MSLSAKAQWNGVGLLVLLALCWGSFWPVMTLSLAEIPIVPFRILTGLGGSSLILSVAVWRGQSLRIPRAVFWPLVRLSLITTTSWLVFSAIGTSILGSGRAVLIAYTMPLWAFLFSLWMLDERPTSARWFGLGAAMTGIVVMVSQDIAAFTDRPAGILAMFAAAIAMGLGSILIKRRDWGIGNIPLAGWQTLFGSLPLLPFYGLQDFNIAAVSWQAWAATAYVAAIGVCAGVIFYMTALIRLPISMATLGVLLVPVVGLSLSAVTVERYLGWPEYIALGFILIGMTTVLPMPSLRTLLRRQ